MAALPPSSAIDGVVADEHGASSSGASPARLLARLRTLRTPADADRPVAAGRRRQHQPLRWVLAQSLPLRRDMSMILIV